MEVKMENVEIGEKWDARGIGYAFDRNTVCAYEIPRQFEKEEI